MQHTPEDLWYAARTTKIVFMPPKLLETFGETIVHYQVFSEDMDDIGLIRLRQGMVCAERPRILTPRAFLNQALENFGEEARRYFDDVMKPDTTALFLQYGLCFRKQEFSEESFRGRLEECADQAAREAQDDLQALRGVVIGGDDTWEVSLLHLITELVRRSVPYHAMNLQRRGLLELDQGLPVATRQELAAAFETCRDLDAARALGRRLRELGVFDEYEDRFYELYRKLKGN